MNIHELVTPPDRPTGLDDLDTGEDLGADHLDTMDDTDDMDDMIDGDRQLTTDSDAIDGGLNDSDLGTPRPTGLDEGLGTDNATGSNVTV